MQRVSQTVQLYALRETSSYLSQARYTPASLGARGTVLLPSTSLQKSTFVHKVYLKVITTHKPLKSHGILKTLWW